MAITANRQLMYQMLHEGLRTAAIVAVSDRRVTDFVSKAIRKNRSTKMTVFGCADAHGVLMYNGIGLDDEGLTPKLCTVERLVHRHHEAFNAVEWLVDSYPRRRSSSTDHT